MSDDREPPPFDENNAKDEDDLFADTPEALPQESISNETSTTIDETPAKVTVKPDINSEDLFGDDEAEDVKLDSDSEDDKDKEEESLKAPLPSMETTSVETKSVPTVEETPKLSVTETTTSSTGKDKVTAPGPTKRKDTTGSEGEDQYTINITVTEPSKVGDGMSAYMTYKVITKTTIPAFRKPELSVSRRFSDFLGLHSKLQEKHISSGIIIPPAPEKSVIGMTKIKMSKEESNTADFIERRRAALERFLNRTASHPVLRIDPDFRDFLERDGDLPKATNTSALSGAGVLRFIHKVGDAVEKISFKMDESDEWFEERQLQIESLESQLRKLHSSLETLTHHRRELSSTTSQFAKSTAMLGNVEEHTALSRALSQLAETAERVETIHADQADHDFFVMAELCKDYVALLGAVKECFQERVKMYKQWKEAESTLTKKRENKVKLELANKNDKIPQAKQEIADWEQKVEKGKEDFEKISQAIRKEVARFDKHRVEDFKTSVITYLEQLMENQQRVIKCWEAFLPEAKAIA